MKLFFTKTTSILLALILFVVSFIPGFSKYKRIEYLDVSYGDNENQKYDLVLPSTGNKDDVGLLLYIHGGAWKIGDKNAYLSSIRSYSYLGIACATMNYRFTDEKTTCFDELDDITSCMNSIIKLGKEQGLNITRVMFMGMSAGAHLSMLYAYSRADVSPLKVCAVYSRSGPANFDEPDFFNNNILGDFNTVADWISDVIGFDFTTETHEEAKPYMAAASPVTYINENSVPTLICHGKKDNLISFDNSVTLDRVLTEKGVKHDYLVFENSDHGLGDDPIMSKLAEMMFAVYIFKYLI